MTNIQIIAAAEQSRADYRRTLTTTGGFVSRPEIDASLAGYAAGWRAAIGYLKLHGALKVALSKAETP